MQQSSQADTPNRPADLGDRLVQKGFLSGKDLESARKLQRDRGGRLAPTLVDLGFVKPDNLLEAQAEQLGLPVLRSAEFPSELPPVEGIPPDYMRNFRFVPVGVDDSCLHVAMADPLDLETLASVQGLADRPVRPVLATEHDILAAIETRFGAPEHKQLADDEAADIEQLRDMASEAPVIRYVNSLISQALSEQASDIHLEPLEEGFRVRYRIDGILEGRAAPARQMRAAVVSRLKLMAGLDIAERRLPQDGRIRTKVLGRDLDLRVATMPTLHGESLALRLLDDATAAAFDLQSLGLGENLLGRMERLAMLPHGLLLVTGPTGSGKTTTLHAALKRVNSTARKIVTIEDPVEYHVEGVNQIHVNPAVGLTFATGLRHIVRQDPDVIMVGEIRDRETAEIAVRAALTGHSVYSTLHTNDAASAITRMVDMGVEHYLLASSLVGVLAQRLVRLLCVQCRTPGDSVPGPDGRVVPTWTAPGCEACQGRGYRGRIGIFELLEVDDPIREIISQQGPARRVAEVARSGGMRSLQEDGWDKVEQGLTSVQEVLAATQDS